MTSVIRPITPRRRIPRLAIRLATALVAGAIALGAQSGPSPVDALLRQKGFSSGDVRALDTGAVVVRSLDTPVREELAHVGVVHIGVPSEIFIERFRDIEAFEKGPGIPQIGRFGHPARIGDLTGLTLPAEDIDALRHCRPGDCDMKLSAQAMRRFQEEVDWSSPHAAAQANVVVREMILELVQAYQRDGNAALGEYEDSGDPMLVAEQFRALLESRDHLPAPVPELFTYLDHYPRGRPAGAVDFFYWTMVDFGLKLTVRVNHVTIYPLTAPRTPGMAYAIAIKQLYASHYFHTTLELRFLVDDHRRGRAGTTLISMTRSRNDGMTGFKGLFLRPIISRRSREGVRRYLVHLKEQVERPADSGF
jgi:hypothetical protein